MKQSPPGIDVRVDRSQTGACVIVIIITAAGVVAPSGCTGQANVVTPKPQTVSSLADATRRLELRDYRYSSETSALGVEFISYERESPDAVYLAEIARWSGDRRLKDLTFYCRTNEDAFNSADFRRKLWTRIHADVCSVLAGHDDYFRAYDDMKKIDGEGIPRFEGRSTTTDGWQVHAIEYVGYAKGGSGLNKNKIPMAMVKVTHMDTDDDMPASAIREFDRQIEGARRNND